MTNTLHHPEQQPDEIYMGNIPLIEVDYLWRTSWRSNRYGTVAYTRSEQVIKDMVPWFIKISEVESAIHFRKNENKPWSMEYVSIYQKMIDSQTVFYYPVYENAKN